MKTHTIGFDNLTHLYAWLTENLPDYTQLGNILFSDGLRMYMQGNTLTFIID